jgi:CRP/FNR family transcriptional regulator, cyclic AMP receptor protein
VSQALSILNDLDEADIAWLSSHGRHISLSAGEGLIEMGRAIDRLYLITAGRFAVSVHGRQVAILDVGDVAGEMSFVDRPLPSANVFALEESRVLAVPRSAMLETFEGNTAFAARFYRALAVFLSNRLRSTTSGEAATPRIVEARHADDQQFKTMIALLDGRASEGADKALAVH